MSSLQFIGTPENFVSVSPDAPAGMPVDEITCAVARADALWGVQCQLELIKKMAYHAHESVIGQAK